jgi:hypothetical protein
MEDEISRKERWRVLRELKKREPRPDAIEKLLDFEISHGWVPGRYSRTQKASKRKPEI